MSQVLAAGSGTAVPNSQSSTLESPVELVGLSSNRLEDLVSLAGSLSML